MHNRLSLRAMAVLLLFLLLVSAWGVFSQTVEAEAKQANLTVTSYETDIEVFEDKSLQIEERFKIHFNVARHGPSFGLAWSYNDKPLIPSVAKGSGDFFFHFRDFLTPMDNYRFGNPFSKLPAGTDKEYSLNYRYQWPADEDPQKDELYWNIINTERPYVHESVKFKVTLPKPFKAGEVYITCGELDSTDQSRVDWQVKGRSIVGRLRGQLAPNEAITLKVHLPEGYFSKARPISYGEQDLRLLLIPRQFLPLLAIPLGYILWLRLGRKHGIVPVVEFYPPDKVNCAEAAWSYFGNSYLSDFSSLIVSWADRGFLTIEEKADKSIWLHRLVVEPIPAPAYEQALFKDMFACGDESQVSVAQLSDEFYKAITKAHKGMLANDQAASPIYDASNGQLSKWMNRLTWLAALVPIYYCLRMALFGDRKLAIYGLIIFVLAAILLQPANKIPRKEKRRGRRTTVANGGYPLGPEHVQRLFFWKLFFLGILLLSSVAFHAPTATLCWLFSMVVLAKFRAHCGRQTADGKSLQGRLAGFREFIRTAELDRIKMLVQENPAYFYDVLPYAAVLGVADDWISKFRTIKVPQPEWYKSERLNDYSRDDFVMGAAMTHALKSFNTLATSSPRPVRSSSSSYDGSSGSSSSSSGSAGGGGGGSSMGDW